MLGSIGLLWSDETPYLLAACLLLLVWLGRALKGGWVVLKHPLLFLVFCLVADAVAMLVMAAGNAEFSGGLHELVHFILGLLLIRLLGLSIFRVLLQALTVRAPRILEDIVVIAAYGVWGLVGLNGLGVDFSSLVATSAVITAVVAFAMQDTLGNILGGLALQFDNSLEIGDWVKVDQVSGRVVEIQWRFTAILTRNGEKVVLPNSLLMKGTFTVLLDPDLAPQGWRRLVSFNVDYGVAPPQVVEAVERAIGEADITGVASDPPPSCVVMDFSEGAVRYVLRYWLLDPKNDDAVDSAVRQHIFVALQRAGWRMALPEHGIRLIQEDEAQRSREEQNELARRLAALSGVELFASLSEGERRTLAERLIYTPFAHGGVVTRQGSVAHWLYLLCRGTVDVVWEAPDGERCLLTTLSAGSVFGEMGLMAGAPRSATVYARSFVECYRLDKSGFEDIIRARPELAEAMSRVLTERVRQIEAAQSSYYHNRSLAEPARQYGEILQKVRDFFKLGN